MFSASFYKINEEDQTSDKIEFFSILHININLTETDINNIDVKSQLEQQNQIQETKDSGWIFDKINTMKKGFYKYGELNGSGYVNFPLSSNLNLNIEDNDKYCFL